MDERGRVQYIVDFVRSAYDGFSDHAVPEVAQRFQSWKSHRSKNFARSFELQYGIVVDSVVSYIGPSITAYLTIEQMERIRRDPRVILVTENSPLTYSSPPWSDSSPVSPPNPETYEMTSWGHAAVNGLTSTVGSGYTKIYVVDSGVAYHNDLQNVTRANPYGTGIAVVGCYAHGTQVASIINASAGSAGTVGVLPGVPIVSVAVNRDNWGTSPTFCGDPSGAPSADVVDRGDQGVEMKSRPKAAFPTGFPPSRE